MGRSKPWIGLKHAQRQKIKESQNPDRKVVKYFERNEILVELGFATYKEYLESELWKGIKSEVFKKSRTCSLCDGLAFQVHHLDYSRETLLGLNPRGLTPICRPCHEKVEMRPNGEKRMGKAAQKKYQEMLDAREGKPSVKASKRRRKKRKARRLKRASRNKV